MENVIHAAQADVLTEADGTVVIRFHPGTRVTLEGTAEIVRAQVAAARGQKRPTLADVRGVIANDRGSRQLSAGPEVQAVTSRMAVLVGNPVSRLLGNFWLRVSNPAHPTQLFGDETAARAWLREPPA
jgi:hypothetical protein